MLLSGVFIFAGALLHGAGSAHGPFVVASPDHPLSWFVTGNFRKIDESLRWNEKDQTLYLDIAYTINGQTPDYEDPTVYYPFTVHFPGVHLDVVTHELYARSRSGQLVLLGRLQPVFFGHRVVLNDNVTVSAHRRNRVIQALLEVD